MKKRTTRKALLNVKKANRGQRVMFEISLTLVILQSAAFVSSYTTAFIYCERKFNGR